MKNIKYIILVFLVLLTTGCKCSYNLTINGDNFTETVTLYSENSEESTAFNQKWEVPINKYEYGIGSDADDGSVEVTKKYDYEFNNNNLTFGYNFTSSSIVNSTAIFNCFKSVTIGDYDDGVVISTSTGATCFDKYPDLHEVTVNIAIDRKVNNDNADSVSGNVYTWNIDETNAATKSINLILDNSEEPTSKAVVPENDTPKNNKIFFDTETYIFAAILFVVLLIGYAIIYSIKSKENDMEDIDNVGDDLPDDNIDMDD